MLQIQLGLFDSAMVAVASNSFGGVAEVADSAVAADCSRTTVESVAAATETLLGVLPVTSPSAQVGVESAKAVAESRQG